MVCPKLCHVCLPALHLKLLQSALHHSRAVAVMSFLNLEICSYCMVKPGMTGSMAFSLTVIS